jgi:hypothetical protein
MFDVGMPSCTSYFMFSRRELVQLRCCHHPSRGISRRRRFFPRHVGLEGTQRIYMQALIREDAMCVWELIHGKDAWVYISERASTSRFRWTLTITGGRHETRRWRHMMDIIYVFLLCQPPRLFATMTAEVTGLVSIDSACSQAFKSSLDKSPIKCPQVCGLR